MRHVYNKIINSVYLGSMFSFKYVLLTTDNCFRFNYSISIIVFTKGMFVRYAENMYELFKVLGVDPRAFGILVKNAI